MNEGRSRLRHVLITLGVIALAWSALLLMTRGVTFTVGALHISSRNARNPGIGALLLLALAAVCAPAGARLRTIVDDLGLPFRFLAATSPNVVKVVQRILHAAMRPRAISLWVAVIVALTLAASWTRGVYIVGGSDSYGYVSEAHLFATGRLRVDLPLADAFPHAPAQTQIPLGYRMANDGSKTIVPMYAPGLPLTMAALERVGGMNAVYAVMPLLAALAVWCSYRIAMLLAGPLAGLGAALLMFASPAFLFQLFGAPMSDVPAAGWWALAAWLLMRDQRWTTAGAGVAAGLAVLTRPNLLLVVVVPGLYLLWKAVGARENLAERVTRIALFSLPVVIGCAIVATLNAVWYGSPLRSGYSADLFNIAYWRDNVVIYPQWLTESQTPLFFVGFLAPFVIHWLPGHTPPDRRPFAIMLVGMVLTVFASYLFYMTFGAWWFLRFLVPSFPLLAALTCVSLAAVSARFGMAIRVLAVAAVIGATVFSLRYAQTIDSRGEYRYRIIGEWARDHLPRRSVILAMQHGGNISHYAGLPIVRYDLLPHGSFEPAIAEIVAAGYHPYLIADEWEIPAIRQAHGDTSSGRLDWPGIAMVPLANLTVWDLDEDREAARHNRRAPATIPVPSSILP